MDTHIQKYCDYWQFELQGDVVQTASSSVMFARWRGQDVVMKVPNALSDEKEMVKILKHYGGEGAVKVLDEYEDAALLERVQPGTPLKEWVLEGKDEASCNVFCEVAAKLHSKPVSSGFRTVENLADNIWKKQDQREEVAKAKALYDALVKMQSKLCLLHGDLHHDNVLFDEQRGWLAIDPKGIIGEPAYEVACFLRNPIGHPEKYVSKNIVDKRVDIICGRLELEKECVLQWNYVGAVWSALWMEEDGLDAEEMWAYARGLGLGTGG